MNLKEIITKDNEKEEFLIAFVKKYSRKPQGYIESWDFQAWIKCLMSSGDFAELVTEEDGFKIYFWRTVALETYESKNNTEEHIEIWEAYNERTNECYTAFEIA